MTTEITPAVQKTGRSGIVGIVVGGIIGLSVGLLAGMGILIIPGIGSLATGGSFYAALIGFALGAGAGALFGSPGEQGSGVSGQGSVTQHMEN